MTIQTDNDISARKTKTKYFLIVIVGLLVLGAAVYLGVPARAQEILRTALEWVRGLGAWGPVLFILLYVAATVGFAPGSILTLGAGAVFGVVEGSIYVSVGATLGATSAFLVGRYLARDWIARKLAHHPRFQAIDHAVAREGWKIVLLTRLSPAFPFVLLNYAFGLTRVSLKHYFLASWIGMMPATVMYVYIGSLASTGVRETTTGEWIFKIVGLIATITVTLYVTRIARRALARKISDEPEQARASNKSNRIG